MRKAFGIAIAALMASTVGASAESWTGKLVDTKCYLMNKEKNAGNDHADKDGKILSNCAAACAQMGVPVALLVGNKLYTISAPAPDFAKYMAKEATVTGKLIGDFIQPEKVVVDGKAIDISGMM